MNDDGIMCVAHNMVEFTLIESLSEKEKMILLGVAEELELDAVVSKSGYIIVVEADHVEEATELLSECGLIEDIGLIKHITEYHIQQESRKILVDFE